MDGELVLVSRARFGRVLLAVLVLGAAAGGIAGAVSELHGPLRMAALSGAGALAGWALAVIVWGASAEAIRPSTRAIERWSRWGTPRWRRVRSTPLPDVQRVVVTRKVLRSSRSTHIVFPFGLEGTSGAVELGTGLDEDETWSRVTVIAAALGAALEDRRVDPPRVLRASSLCLPAVPEGAPKPPPGCRLRVERSAGTLRVFVPPPGAGPEVRIALRWTISVLLFFLTMMGIIVSLSHSLVDGLYRALALLPLALAGGMPFFLVVLSAWFWGQSVAAGPDGLVLTRHLPFPAASTRWPRGGLLDLAEDVRGAEVPWIGVRLDGPCLRAVGGAGGVRFASGCSRAELEWLRGALLHALEAGKTDTAPDRHPIAPGRGGALAFLLVGALVTAGACHEPWLGTVIARHADEARQRLGCWQALAREATDRPAPAADGFTVSGTGIAFRWDWEETCNAAAVHVEDLLAAGDPPEILRVVRGGEWLHDWAGAISATPSTRRAPEENPTVLESEWGRWHRLRYLLLVCRRPQAEAGGFRGIAWLVDLDGPRWLGAVTFGASVAGSRIDEEVAAETDLEEKLGKHLPEAEPL